jgi:L-fucose dehydrogenase
MNWKNWHQRQANSPYQTANDTALGEHVISRLFNSAKKTLSMDLHLANKIIIVSGGAKGIGEGICQVLAHEKAIPVIVGRNQSDNLHALAAIQNSGGTGFAIEAELSDPAQCAYAIEATVQQYGRIDGLVNNAGANDGIGLENGNYEQFMASLHKNVVHYYLLAHHALPHLKTSKGPIVNISSKTAETGQGGTSAYAAANGARNALTREWAVELLQYGIRVNALIVAECWTPLYARWIQTLSEPEAMLKKIKARIPLGNRMTTAAEIANMVAFLLSEKSSHTTGQLIHVDGGYVHLDRAID